MRLLVDAKQLVPEANRGVGGVRRLSRPIAGDTRAGEETRPEWTWTLVYFTKRL